MISRRSVQREQGASLVEFAVVMPLFLLMLFGVIESGYLFAQLNETRNAAREGARIAVVDFGDASALVVETCNRSTLTAGGTAIAITTIGDVTDPISDPTAAVTVAVTKSYDSLTGFLDPFFQGNSLDSTVTMRVERPLTNLGSNSVYAAQACP